MKKAAWSVLSQQPSSHVRSCVHTRLPFEVSTRALGQLLPAQCTYHIVLCSKDIERVLKQILIKNLLV